MTTLVDCGCVARVHADGSGVEIDFCDLHRAAPELLAACEKQLAGLTARPYNFSLMLDAHRALESAVKLAHGTARASTIPPPHAARREPDADDPDCWEANW